MSPQKIKILLIEDDSFLSSIYLKKFNLEGFDIQSAPEGEKGIELARAQKPDVILLDILLPKKDGFAVLEELKKDPATQAIPVIVMTNLSEDDNISRAFDLGAVDYLIKSNFLPDEVIDKVKNALR